MTGYGSADYGTNDALDIDLNKPIGDIDLGDCWLIWE
jgi:hypothetical protein